MKITDDVPPARIISGVGGKYTVLQRTDNGKTVIENIAAKGAFRHEKIKLLPGDKAYLRSDENGYFITDIEERKNALIRPAVANLDYLYIVISCKQPAPVPYLSDKMTVLCEKNGIIPVIVVTKSELDKETAKKIEDVYGSCGYRCFITSSEKKTGIKELRDFADGNKGTVSAFCGASGVGKSTLLNNVYADLDLSCGTGQISRKTERGKNTTRTVTLYETADDTYLADTPGFSLLDFERFDFCKKDELPYLFPEFGPYLCKCRYTKCSHTKEDGCLIRKAVEDGRIPGTRYESYLSLYDDVKDKKEWETRNN